MSTVNSNLESFVKPIQDAVFNALSSMGQVTVVLESKKIVPSSELGFALGDVSGVVAINAEKITGSLALCFDSSLICKFYSNILGGTPVTSVDADVKDAAMEVTNVVFGNAKRDINKFGFDIKPSLPSVVTGSKHTIHHPQKSQCLCLSFKSEFGRLYIECSALM